MAGLESTIGKLIAQRKRWESLIGGEAPADGRKLMEVPGFGLNPGGLRMLAHVPQGLPPGSPLVVVLHGCTQTGSGYDQGAGWSELADRCGFAVLVPEQVRANNANVCFNWFQPDDIRRDHGEVGSIRQMVAWMVDTLHLDARRVFVTGLSAGGAMTAALLATYPEVFAAGAIIAGLPYGCAGNVQEAVDCMFHGHDLTPRAWGERVRLASSHRGPWPQVAIWHGSADTVVVPANAAASILQWTDVHDLPAEPTIEDTVDGCVHRVWQGRDRAPLVSSFMVPGMGHGTPIDPASSDPARRCGTAMPHMLDVGVPSTIHIARSWGLISGPLRAAAAPAGGGARPRAVDPAGIIARALRSAGLLGE